MSTSAFQSPSIYEQFALPADPPIPDLPTPPAAVLNLEVDYQHVWFYTAGQMREYARKAALEERERAEVVSNGLLEAAQAVVDRWDSPDWKDGTHTADYIHRLRVRISIAKATGR